MAFDYEGAKAAGYTDAEINSYLLKTGKKKEPMYENATKEDSVWSRIGKNARNFWNNLGAPTGEKPEQSPKDIDLIDQRLLKKVPFDVEGALNAGYSPYEINAHLQENLPKKSNLEKGGRLAAQYGLGALQASPAGFAYEVASAPLGSEATANQAYREELGNDLELLMDKKSSGDWNEQDEQLLEHITRQILDPRESAKYAQTTNIGIRDLAEGITGSDLHPEGILEKSAEWLGFIRNPSKFSNIAKNISKTGMTPSNLGSLLGGKDLLKSMGAGAALELAEQNDFGPIGTIGAAIIGDLGGEAIGGIGSAAKKLVSPSLRKAYLANKTAKLTPVEKLDIQKDLIKSLRKHGIQANLGTITDNKAIQGLEAKLQQSAFSGESPEKLKKSMSDQIKRDYERVAKSLGESKFKTLNEGGEFGKDAIKSIRDAEKSRISEIYKEARAELNESSRVDSTRIAESIKYIEKSLKPGKLKSKEQQAVLNALDTIKNDIYETSSSNGTIKRQLKEAGIFDLMNTKIALQDIIDYEVQGGQKQLLKQLVKDIDRAIISHGKQNPKFSNKYIRANQEFSEHAKTFRNSNIDKILRSDDPMTIINKMDSVQGTRDIKKALMKSPNGKEKFNNLARTKLDQLIGNKMSDNISEQIKTGKFANLLENPKTNQLVKELLPPHAFERLKELAKNSGKIADAAQKFFNASKSGVTIVDAGLISKALMDFYALLAGNPWPLLKSGSVGLTAHSMTKLMFDPEFIKLVEDAILASEKNDINAMLNIGKGIQNKLIQAGIATSNQIEEE